MLTIAISLFSSNVSSMQSDDEKTSLKSQHRSSTSAKEKESCSHWGLTRWAFGIKEYTEEMFNCYSSKQWYFDNKTEKSYSYSSSYSRMPEDPTTNCWLEAWTGGYGRGSFCCCPCATLIHLCCLPCACCCITPYPMHLTNYTTQTNYPSTNIYPSTENDKERERAHQAWREGEWDSGDIDRRLKAGWGATRR